MKLTKLDSEIFEKIKKSRCADDWTDYIGIWSECDYFSRPEWRLHRLCDFDLMERKLIKINDHYYNWNFRMKIK